jgi:branched-subunit amino acid transport protein
LELSARWPRDANRERITTVFRLDSTPTEDALFLQSSLLGNNPFAVLTAIVAPAILTNASSVLALGTSNRLGRVVDRTRVVYSDLAATAAGSREHIDWTAQLAALRARAQMLLRALRLFYAALGLFAASALVAVGGSLATFYGKRLLFEVAAGLAVMTGASAVVGLAVGCTLMVHETRLAVQSLAAEAEIRVRPAQPDQRSPKVECDATRCSRRAAVER